VGDLWWTPSWEALCDKYAAQGYSALSPDERLWINIRGLIDATENGGLISFFYNSGADTLPDCLAALDALSASDVKAQVARVTALFPEGVPATLEGRNEAINSWDDDNEETDRLLEDVDHNLYELFENLELTLERYLRSRGLGTVSV